MEETDVKDPNLKQSLESATSQISQLALSNSPTGVANLAAVFLFPLFINYFQMGVTGAATATVVSQYIGSFLMIWFLSKRVILLPPKFGDLKFGVYLKSGGFLIGRTVAVLITMTIGTSMAARQGPLAMAAHQICMQVWLAVSLLTDGLAASGQVYTPRNAPILVRKLMWFVSNGLSVLPASIYYWLERA
ncbi:protein DETOXIFICATION 45, chloroplastic-like [Spinacia oleracea]|uniref:Protein DETOXIFICATION 45, chloroplastic-like n=2 Tax=Spinacia oleracea TaxID=3562 RepID=A0ABM3R5B9_SPIOL|nr:protein DETOXIFICATION 45, chloroplastic-like [Spinacia oleracea]XP_056686248.1 protein DETOXIFICATION 45, chloroplastic-like [Spinacia oleracea]XP_056690789.1 protein DETOXIFICATION 45, chloroplastic-like [Spinacia oleracea]XP_056694535.1 protein DETOXIFICATION 45, chloroplastic-like [Spinacia oleracea]